MNPPTEQLIRDYLNRVSVAARGRLSADDRRAFLARTREYIEQNTRALGHTDAADVLRLLADLGDPAALVTRERERLAARGSESAAEANEAHSLTARARRLRSAPANVASILRASAAAVAPGDAAVPEPADDNPLTGDVSEQVRRPISSRWKPGEVIQPKPQRPRRVRRLRPGAPASGGGQDAIPAARPEKSQFDISQFDEDQSDAAQSDTAQSDAAQAADRQAPEAPPLPADNVPSSRPEWPARAARRPSADEPGPGAGPAPALGPAPAAGPGPAGGQVNGQAHGAGASPPPAPDRPSVAHPPVARPPAAQPPVGHPPAARPPAAQPPPDRPSVAHPPVAQPPVAHPPARPPAARPPAARPPVARPPAARPPAAEEPSAETERPASTQAPAAMEQPPAATGSSPATRDSGGPGKDGATEPPGADGDLPAGPPAAAAEGTASSGSTIVGRVVPQPADAGGPAAEPGEVPPRGARIAWASGVRSARTRLGGLRGGSGSRGSTERPGAVGRPGGAGRLAGAWADRPRKRRRPDYGHPGPSEGAEPAVDAESQGLAGRLGAAAGSTATRTLRTAVAAARRHPLEATAVVLLGLGGVIYPPVWLMGAAIATLSKIWDIRDKWIGLALPIMIVVIWSAIDATGGGNHLSLVDHLHKGWIFGGHLSRILAVLSACYLIWRVWRGRRPSPIPPWKKPHSAA